MPIYDDSSDDPTFAQRRQRPPSAQQDGEDGAPPDPLADLLAIAENWLPACLEAVEAVPARRPSSPGAKSKFQARTLAIILAAAQLNNSLTNAARLAGIHYDTLARWLDQAAQSEPGYTDFSELLQKATGIAEHSLIQSIHKAGDTNWTARAWIAERRYRSDWARQDVLDVRHSGQVQHNHDLTIVALPSPAQYLTTLQSLLSASPTGNEDESGNGNDRLLLSGDGGNGEYTGESGNEQYTGESGNGYKSSPGNGRRQPRRLIEGRARPAEDGAAGGAGGLLGAGLDITKDGATSPGGEDGGLLGGED